MADSNNETHSSSGMPGYRRLRNEVLRGRLLTIRESVTPILASNLLRSFTDHSVLHSDRLCDLIDELTASMGDHALNDTEAFILYAAAYLHDMGMQHERCDETQASPRRRRRSCPANVDAG